MNLELAEKLMLENLSNPNLQSHSYAVGCVMKKLAQHFGEDESKWEIAGILHDIDYDQTFDNPEKHGFIAMEMLAEHNLDETILHTIKAHAHQELAESIFDKALIAADPITGLITAAALMRPDKSIKTMKLSSLKKKFKNKKFAAGANRDQIKTCENIGIELADFLQLSMEAMAEIETKLGLGSAE
jgi:putative nucleotidyltransferase with HDIG domain